MLFQLAVWFFQARRHVREFLENAERVAERERRRAISQAWEVVTAERNIA